MIYHKSEHPVEVKKISIRLWSLRDEIEAALSRRMKECEAAAVPLYIDDIREYYNLLPKGPNNIVALKTAESKEKDLANFVENISPVGKEDEKGEEKPQEAKTEEANSEEMKAEEVKSEEVKAEESSNEIKADEKKDHESSAAPAENNLNKAEEIIAEQTKQGLENNKPNPILLRPYKRQPPDLDKISYGFVLLSDINMENMLTFTKGKFVQGQSVVVEFLIPQNFMMAADVTYCHNFAMRSRIISSTKPDYRVQCKFLFSASGERDNLRSFLKSIEPVLQHETKKEKKSADIDPLEI